jgi:DNA-binding NarL/FixJ family response regulator
MAMVYIDTTPPINVLLISNNEIDNKKIQRELMDPTLLACRLFNFSSVDSAISKMEKTKANVDVIILDLSVQFNASDFEVCQNLHAVSENIKIIVLTDFFDDTVSLELYKDLGVAAQTNRNHFSELQNLLRAVLYPERHTLQ